MERLKQMKLKKALFTIAFLNITVALILSLLAIWGCAELRSHFAAEGIGIIVDEQSEQVVVKQMQAGSEGEETIADILSAVQIILPIIIYICALFLSASMFYRLKLREPIETLAKGANRIIANDLDFEMKAESEDELGQLCTAFETMRKTLLANHRELWRQAEERRRLNAAFAHDLRNPVTVLKGSVKLAKHAVTDGAGDVEQQREYSERREQKEQREQETQKEQEVQQKQTELREQKEHQKQQRKQKEQLAEHLQRIESYTDRIEQYVEIMSSIQKLEEIAVHREVTAWDGLILELENMIRLIGADSQKEIHFQAAELTEKSEKDILLDKSILFQIAENLVANAVRFANHKITVQCNIEEENLLFTVSDDGCGFPDSLLQKGIQPFQKGREDAAHFGMGLYLCKLLCEKHGGTLSIQNNQTGASVCAVIKIQ